MTSHPMRNQFFFLLVFISGIFSCGAPKENAEAPKPSGSCVLSRDDKDPMGKRIRMIQDEKFISLAFPDTASRNVASSDEFFKGYLSCVSVDTVMGIYVNFKIYSDKVFDYYGMLKKDNKIMFILKSGKSVELPFGSTFSGNTDLSKDFTEYSSLLYLPPSAAEKLLTEELEKVKITWSKKEEDYVVVNPNIFINQLPCLK